VSKYHINIYYSEQDRGYIADIPDLASCSASGKTPEQALAKVLRAKQAWLEAARAARRPAPRPRYRPAIYVAKYSTEYMNLSEAAVRLGLSRQRVYQLDRKGRLGSSVRTVHGRLVAAAEVERLRQERRTTR